jgi:hypothetical protein
MITPADESRLQAWILIIAALAEGVGANRPDLAGADSAIDDALASLDSARADLRYALVAVQDALSDADSREAGYEVSL